MDNREIIRQVKEIARRHGTTFVLRRQTTVTPGGVHVSDVVTLQPESGVVVVVVKRRRAT